MLRLPLRNPHLDPEDRVVLGILSYQRASQRSTHLSGAHGKTQRDRTRRAVTATPWVIPYEDTACPAINPMIKIVDILALLLLAALGTHPGQTD